MWSVFLGLALQSAAPDELGFCADRPGLATGTCIVPVGKVQLETSFVDWSRTRSSGDTETSTLVGASRLRIGLREGSDLQIAFTPYADIRLRGGEKDHVSGVGDVTVAVKQSLVGRATWSVALLPFAKLPVAKRSLGNGKLEVGLLLPLEIDLGDSLSLTLTPEADLNADSDGDGYHLRAAIAGSLGVALDERWTVAVDGLWARERDDGLFREAAIGLSVARQIGDHAQVDAEVNAGLDSGSPDWRLVSGFAVRF